LVKPPFVLSAVFFLRSLRVTLFDNFAPLRHVFQLRIVAPVALLHKLFVVTFDDEVEILGFKERSEPHDSTHGRALGLHCADPL
jgi:hypothetical protein